MTRQIGWSRGLRVSGKTPEQEQEERVTYKEVKIELIKKSGGKCFLCGYNRSWAALHFHHRERHEKTASVSALLGRYIMANEGNGKQRYLTLLEDEVKKCILLCSNCHVEITHRDWENEQSAWEDRSLRGVRKLLWYRRWISHQPTEVQDMLKRLWTIAHLHDSSFNSWGISHKLRTLRPDVAREIDEQTKTVFKPYSPSEADLSRMKILAREIEAALPHR